MYPDQPQYNFTQQGGQPVQFNAPVDDAALRRKRSIQLLIALVAVTVFVLFVQWISTHGYIQIITQNAAEAPINYTLTNQASGESIEFTSDAAEVRRLVPTGEYEVIVNQETNNGFALATTKRFLQSTNITVSAEPEKQRTFVGDGPNPCMAYVDMLYSYSCGSYFTSLQAHLPATASSSTITKTTDEVSIGTITGIVTVKGDQYVIVRDILDDETGITQHILYPLNQNLSLSLRNAIALHDLPGDAYYSVRQFQSGFILYSDSDTAYYYQDPEAAPTVIKLASPQEDTNLFTIGVSTKRIAAAYSELDVDEVLDIHDEDDTKGTMYVTISDGDASASYIFDRIYRTILPCGTQKLCMLSGSKVDVYDLNTASPERLFSISNVSNIEQAGDSVIITKDKQLLLLNADTQNGSIAYQLGEYTSCGTAPTARGILLCVLQGSKKSALLIDTNENVANPIDKQILQLNNSADISSYSIYGNQITIAQNMGPPVYNPELQIFDYDRTRVQQVTNRINRQLREAGIDTERYRVVYTY